MQDQDTPASVLVVDDEREVADLYAAALEDAYAVQTAYSGLEALELLVFEPDVILLDRRMPGLSGTEVLEEIRAREVDVRAAMVSGVEPDFDVVDMPFDDYLVKPVGPTDLRDLVDRLVVLDRFEEKRVELSSRRVTRNVLEHEKTEAELRASEEYAALQAEIRQLETEIDNLRSRLGDDYPPVAAMS